MSQLDVAFSLRLLLSALFHQSAYLSHVYWRDLSEKRFLLSTDVLPKGAQGTHLGLDQSPAAECPSAIATEKECQKHFTKNHIFSVKIRTGKKCLRESQRKHVPTANIEQKRH